MLEKLAKIKERYEELGERLGQPEVISDQKLFRELAKEHSSLGEIVAVYDEYAAALSACADCRAMLEEESDAELRELAHEELREAEETADGMIVRGKRLTGGACDSFGDHRIAMSAAVASVQCAGPVTVSGAEAVEKSYPRFWEDFSVLGGDVKRTVS